ncbi:thrS: threonine--tRNA ligase [Gaiella occulta]|uniref:Threonine--tRNA ligase n=1 Tax=Gaiella occulta TaxID=1002870 RepID=A0A7M2YTH3_9ACTN|nr:threonine--tRNA ligase [Gaiella occulta]RDI73386.1 thrS: threonine--tRNA ligase [Gaiella occulta]
MKVILPDETELRLPDGATGLDAARVIGPRLAEQAVLVKADGVVHDLRQPLPDGARLQILTTRDRHDPDALYVLRHSAAHLLAEAVRRLYPGVKIAIGPPIEGGFYYDFEFPQPISEADLERIEAEVRRELAEGRTWSREEISADEARARFAAEGEPYKVELVDSAQGAITLYTQGDFTDLCRGPHLQDSSPIKAFKLTSLAGAYWRGDEHNTQLTRIYGTAFYSQDDLEAHLERLEQARARDHRRLGPQLDLFHFSEISPGSPFWHPKGMAIWNVLEDLRRSENAARGYVEVRTPQIYDKELWLTSGHWQKYREHMFTFESEEREFGLKPMNCPGHCALYAHGAWSYRDLPLRMAEAGNLHRNELSGALHGLLRARMFAQDDAHLFCTPEQVEDEVLGCLEFGYAIYDRLGLEITVELSTRPENKLGSDEEWDRAEAALAQALERKGIAYTVNAGDGAFYGPKIDLHMLDSLARSWQIGTVQLDFQLPQRFGLRYQGADNAEHAPVMIHRALIGSFERFIGILLEHFGGAFPLWLAPVQVRVLPVGEAHRAAAGALAGRLRGAGYRVELDEREETLGKRIRDSEIEKVPVVVVFGERESEAALAVRTRGEGQSTLSLDELLARLAAGAAAGGG